MKIGFFGGTFDPPHLGHLHFAYSLMESHAFDQVWFSLTRQNPLKERHPTGDLARLEMVKRAIEPFDHFKIYEEELMREPPIYTIDTVNQLQKEPHDFYLLMGEKSAREFHLWHDFLEIEKKIPIVVGSFRPKPCDLRKSLLNMWTLLPLYDFSSSEIRERIQKGLPVDEMVPDKVVDYFQENQLYL